MTEDQIYPVNVAQNKGYSIRESAQMIARAIGFEGELTFNTKLQDGDPVKIMDDKEFRKHFEYYKGALKLEDTATLKKTA